MKHNGNENDTLVSEYTVNRGVHIKLPDWCARVSVILFRCENMCAPC